jgi:hypothetical protein
MTVRTIREIAKKTGLTLHNFTKTRLVRSIQKDKGNSPCFATNDVFECTQKYCSWREDCSITYFKQIGSHMA